MATDFESAVSANSTTRAQQLAEGIRIELMDPFRSHGLASRCIATLPTFLFLVVASGLEPPHHAL